MDKNNNEYSVGKIQQIKDNEGDFFMLRCTIFTNSDKFELDCKEFAEYGIPSDSVHIQYESLMSFKKYWVIINIFCNESEMTDRMEKLKDYTNDIFEQQNDNKMDKTMTEIINNIDIDVDDIYKELSRKVSEDKDEKLALFLQGLIASGDLAVEEEKDGQSPMYNNGSCYKNGGTTCFDMSEKYSFSYIPYRRVHDLLAKIEELENIAEHLNAYIHGNI